MSRMAVWLRYFGRWDPDNHPKFEEAWYVDSVAFVFEFEYAFALMIVHTESHTNVDTCGYFTLMRLMMITLHHIRFKINLRMHNYDHV